MNQRRTSTTARRSKLRLLVPDMILALVVFLALVVCQSPGQAMAASSGPTVYRTGFTTDINELDVIYGGEKRLFKAVREIIEKYNPPAVFV